MELRQQRKLLASLTHQQKFDGLEAPEKLKEMYITIDMGVGTSRGSAWGMQSGNKPAVEFRGYGAKILSLEREELSYICGAPAALGTEELLHPFEKGQDLLGL